MQLNKFVKRSGCGFTCRNFTKTENVPYPEDCTDRFFMHTPQSSTKCIVSGRTPMRMREKEYHKDNKIQENYRRKNVKP